MKLSILMAGLANRTRHVEEQIVAQINRLQPHCDHSRSSNAHSNNISIHHLKPLHHQTIKAEFIRVIDWGDLTSGAKRRMLTELASGDYVCFVDDDDILAENYVSRMLEGCRSGADVVTFNLQMQHDGKIRDMWQFGLYPNRRNQGLMCVNHLCAWKREIATLVNWDPLLGNTDDRLWFEPLYYAHLIRSQYHINEILYYYQYHSNVSVNQQSERIRFAKSYFNRGLRCFRRKDTNEIVVETNPKFIDSIISEPGHVLVRNKNNKYMNIEPQNLIHYHTVKL